MHQFFSSSVRGADLLILRGKLGILHERVRHLAYSYEDANRQIETIENMLCDTQNRESSLAQQHMQKDIECEQKRQEQILLELEHEKLENEKHTFEQELQPAITKKDDKERQRDALKQSKETLEERIASLQIEIENLDNIINSPGPKPRYILDGLVCINGIPNCKNHPPRQILENAEEIKRHQRAVSEATSRKQNLLSKKSSLEEECNKLVSQLASVETEILSAQVNCMQLQDRLKDLENKLEENKMVQEKTAREYEILLHEITDIQMQIQQIKSEEDRLASELEALKQNAMTIQYNQQILENEIQALSAQLEQLGAESLPNRRGMNHLDLEELARREVMQEEARKQSQLYDRQALEDLARRELDAEAQQANNDWGSNLIANAADLLLNGAIDVARSAGRISEQARINLRNIKNFGNNALNDLNKKIDEFDNDLNTTSKVSP